jgi:hypothetical protein
MSDEQPRAFGGRSYVLVAAKLTVGVTPATTMLLAFNGAAIDVSHNR